MTKARDLANIISGGFTADDIPNLDAAKITSGTFADARIAASNVSQHAQSFDDNKLVNDISTLALRQASNENKSAYNTNSMYVDVFQDSTGIASNTNANRDPNEYVSAATESADSATTYSYTGSDQTYTPSGKSKMDVVMWGGAGSSGFNFSYSGGAGRASNTGGAGGFTSGTIAITGSPTFKIMVGGGGTATDVNGYSGSASYGYGGRGRVQGHHGVGGGGGGLSGIFLTSVSHSNAILIAGGGAGAVGEGTGSNDYSGNGGGSTGQDGGLNDSSGHLADGNGKGGTQSAGGSGGAASSSYTVSAGSALSGADGLHMGGGGGGGYYGGGAGGHTSNYGSSGSGGGSGYIGGHASASVTNGVTTAETHTNYSGSKTPPQTSHSSYSSGIGRGNEGANGGNGLIVITPYSLSVNATGNFISNAITASASTNKMGAIITYEDNQGTNALNTDIIIQLSADNGSNFTTATLVAMPDFATGIKMCKVNDLSVTAGTQLKYKILFANQSGSKIARIRGVSLQY